MVIGQTETGIVTKTGHTVTGNGVGIGQTVTGHIVVT